MDQPEIVWSEELHQQFVDAVNSLGGIASEALQACKVLPGCETPFC